MNTERPSACLIASALEAGQLRLQPWHYLHQVAQGLAARGHPVKVISDGFPHLPAVQQLDGVTLHRLRSAGNPWWRPNAALHETLRRLAPDVVLWHVGLTSFLHQRLACSNEVPIAGIFTSPIYRSGELSGLGWRKLGAGRHQSALHLASTLVPRALFRWLAKRNRQLKLLVVQTRSTRSRIQDQGLWPGPVEVIAPGVDGIWLDSSPNGQARARAELGYGPDQKIVVYFGPAAPLRGLPALIRAIEMARKYEPALELLILCRPDGRDEDVDLKRLLAASPARDHIKLVRGYLEPGILVDHVTAGDVVALPFELVPSDAPLSVLEALALGKPLVTTDVAGLPDLPGHDSTYITKPADEAALSASILKAMRDGRACSIQGPPSRLSCVRSWADVGREWSALLQAIAFEG